MKSSVAVYIRRDTQKALAELRARLGARGQSLSRVMCLAIRELSQHTDPLLVVSQRLAQSQGPHITPVPSVDTVDKGPRGAD